MEYVCGHRSGFPDGYQAIDAVVEEFNANIKDWVFGDRKSDMWRSIVRNYSKLTALREKGRFKVIPHLQFSNHFVTEIAD